MINKDYQEKDELLSRFIVITGGVCSSLGKGVLVSSLGVLLQAAGYSVAVIKCDPYLNVDPGTMSPLEHGEVFVTADGFETDLDLGHYERLLNISLTKESSLSAGQIFQSILDGERQGSFLGKCIQMVPHVVDAIKNRLISFAQLKKTDFILVEVGGTVGDMEAMVFLEAIRQLKIDMQSHQLYHAHLSYVPFLSWTGEVKTKPTQHSVNELKHAGIVPDALFLRADQSIPAQALQKVAGMCGVSSHDVFQVLTYNPVYALFFDLERQGVAHRIQHYFGLKEIKKPDLTPWQNLLQIIEQPASSLNIVIVAKYVGSNDPYISVIEAIKAAAYHEHATVTIQLINAEHLEKGEDYASAWEALNRADGIIVPGGFDKRGTEGKIAAATWARKTLTPYFGLCLGFQMMLVEFARNLLGLKDAHSTEINPEAKVPIIHLLSEQMYKTRKGGTMRLGEFDCSLVPNTIAHKAYQADMVYERHRHRYEFNNEFRELLEGKGVIFSGINNALELVEIAELESHPFMVGTQFHPEFKSRPLHAHPLFKAFIKAALENKVKKT